MYFSQILSTQRAGLGTKPESLAPESTNVDKFRLVGQWIPDRVRDDMVVIGKGTAFARMTAGFFIKRTYHVNRHDIRLQ
jgi:hypothetical protein